MDICLEDALERVVAWAKEVGEVQRCHFRGYDLGIETKSNAYDVVTKVDKLSENMLLERIGAAFPGHGVLGEESGGHRTDSDYLWVVDPLDGTNNYSQGLPIFAISVGLQYRGETMLGVVYAPYFGEMYTAVRGGGAWLNGKRIHVGDKDMLKYCVLGTGFPYDKDVNPANNADNLARILPHIRGVRRMGSAAYDLCCVAAGFLDGYWEICLHPWDICAGLLVLEEAGGVVEQFRPDREINLVAGNPRVVERMKEYIR